MKKISIVFFTIAVALNSCSSDKSILYQDSPSTFETAKVFSTYALAKSAIDGIMETAVYNTDCYPMRFSCFYGANTDIEINIGFSATDNDLQRYNATPTHARLNSSGRSSFSWFYSAIENANLAIKNLKKYGDIENDERMRILYAQALTLRAHFYYDLTKAWGDVPARFEPVSETTIYLRKSNRDIIFKQIMSDLEEAFTVLPYPGEHELTATPYYVNKIYCAGLFARVALMASGYAQRPDDDKIGTGDKGTIRLSSDPLLAKDVVYKRALALLKEIIEADKMTLVQDYKEYWRRFNNSELGKYPTEETVFALPFGSTMGRWNYSFAVRLDKAGGWPWGASIGHSPITGPNPAFYFDYDPSDKRRDVTCHNSIMKGASAYKANSCNWFFGKFRMDQEVDYPYLANSEAVKPVVMRYSDIYLMAAEMENEIGTLDQAKAYFLPVRSRAFTETQANGFLSKISNKEQMFNAIVDERAFEFCGEMLRKVDLIRWNMLKQKMDEAKQKQYDLRDLKGKYSFIPKDVYWKINPNDPYEMLHYGFNPGETDNPGAGWTKWSNFFNSYDDNSTTNTYQLCKYKIESLYVKNPDEHQFWPIPAEAITNNQGYLVNDYGY